MYPVTTLCSELCSIYVHMYVCTVHTGGGGGDWGVGGRVG